MKKHSKITSVVLGVGIVAGIISQALADSPYEKNKMPCLESVCIGDDIKSLQNIPWVPVDKLLGGKQSEGWKVVGDTKSFQKLLPYLSVRAIDKKGIVLLTQIKGFCEGPFRNPIFTGEYKGKDGKPITVMFDLLTSPDYKSQKIIVSTISKEISATPLSLSQMKSLDAEVQKRYPNSNKGSSATTAHAQGSLANNKFYYFLYYRAISGADVSQALMEFPGCTPKIEL